MFLELLDSYSSKTRSGVAEPVEGLELYFIPPGRLATIMLAAAHSATDVKSQEVLHLIPKSLEDNELLVVIIHRKVRPDCPRDQCQLAKHASVKGERYLVLLSACQGELSINNLGCLSYMTLAKLFS